MSRPPHSHPWPDRNQRGFTLVEIAVVVTLLGLLVAIALPGYRRVTLKSKAAAAMNDLRTFSAAFVNYNLQNANWPVSTGNPGEIPPEMIKSVGLAFAQTTPIGGKYEWISNSTYKAAIGITIDGSTDMELLELIDTMMDNGATTDGNLRISGPELIYIIEEK